MQIVKELATVHVASAAHQRRRIVVLKRDDGRYTFAEQYHYVNRYEDKVVAEGWATMRPEGIYATATIAETEARAAYSAWYGSVR